MGGPAILFSKRGCPRLIADMGGGYRFTYTNLDTSRALPDKDQHSHLPDALQYGIMGFAKSTALQVARAMRPRVQPKARVNAAGWT
jgi:hypothetical protein